MYSLVFVLGSQIACLVSLVHSGHEDFYLFWYIPNWISAVLLVIPTSSLSDIPLTAGNTKTTKAKGPHYFSVLLFSFISLVNLGLTASPLFFEPWVGIAPAVVTVSSSLAYEYVK